MAAVIRGLDRLLRTRFVLWVRVLQFFVAVGVFTYAALMPANHISTTQPDHTLHFVGNALLFLSASVAAFGRLKLGLLVLLLIPYSLLIELSQWLTPSRHVDSADVLANMLGLTCGYIIAHAVEWLWSKLAQAANAGATVS